MDQPLVFISYRREETAGHAGRLRDSLCSRFGEDHVFMDLEMAPGIDFVDELDRELSRCDVLLVVIGREWGSVRDATGRLRLQDPHDFVRREIETALARSDVLVVPVLVQGAQMPSQEQLPETMGSLARRNALELSDARWSFDVERLVSHLHRKTTVTRIPRQLLQYNAASAFLVGAALAVLPTWGLQRFLVNGVHSPNAEAGRVIVRGALVRGIPWAVFAAIVAAWAVYVARAGRPARAAATAFVMVAIAGAVGGAFAQMVRDNVVHSFNINTALVLSFVIVGPVVVFAAVRVAAPEARIAALLLGLIAGALAGWLRTGFSGSHPSVFKEFVEVALQGLAFAAAAAVAVVLTRSLRSAESGGTVAGRAHVTSP
jgi:TIR domain